MVAGIEGCLGHWCSQRAVRLELLSQNFPSLMAEHAGAPQDQDFHAATLALALRRRAVTRGARAALEWRAAVSSSGSIPRHPLPSTGVSSPPDGRASPQDAPLVSIVTPVYNAAPYLEATIASVLEQHYPRVEYIVLDDGSTDETPEVIASYSNRLLHVRHDNMGEARTVNRGFELTHGEIIGVVSADDPLLPGIVTAMVQRFAADPSVLVVYPDWEMIDDEGCVMQHIATYDYSYRNMVRWHHCVPGPGTFFRRSVVARLGGRDPSFRYVADYDFWLHAGLLGPFARLPRTLARYRHHAGSASVGQLGPSMASEHIRMMDKLFARQDLPHAIRRVRREAYSSAHWVAGVVVGDENQTARRYHYRRAVLLAPHKYLGEYRKSRLLPTIVPTLLGGRLMLATRLLRNAPLHVRHAREKVWARLRV